MLKTSPLLVAQITDIHLFAENEQKLLGFPTYESFKAVIEHLNQLQPKPNILLITGDLSQDETDASYQQLQSLIAPLNIPTYWLPGNHDNLPAMEQILNQPPIFADKFFAAGGWQFLLLSSWIPGCVHGELSSASLEWLDKQLQLIGEQPTLIALHHPPCLIDSAWMDEIKLKNSSEFFAVIDRYSQVKLVLFGHIHQPFENSRRDISYLGSPSTCVQFKPKSAKFALDNAQPGFRLLNLLPDGTFKTRIERVNYN